ncbi:hypothetical protein C8R44DRAFT_742245 [Mycena epipterygia]|nr:hypothetical protein C8R44DRAFT_742245 [Mycena epipterygia]
MDSIIVFNPANPEHVALIPAFANIHIACIETDHMIATFLPLLKCNVIIDWWKERAAGATDNKRIIFMALAEDPQGCQQLAGSVEKLLVSLNFRHRKTWSPSGALQSAQSDQRARVNLPAFSLLHSRARQVTPVHSGALWATLESTLVLSNPREFSHCAQNDIIGCNKMLF